MTLSSTPPASKRNDLLVDLPIRLHSALRTIRLYPPTNPQVQRSNDAVCSAVHALMTAYPGSSVTIAFTNSKVFVCGERLPEKDQARPQLQGLVIMSNRCNLRSFTFRSTFSPEQCTAFIQTISAFLGDLEIEESVAMLLDKAGVTSVAVDLKRYVTIHADEQIVPQKALNPDLDLIDEKLANFVFDTINQDSILRVSTQWIQDVINLLPSSDAQDQHLDEVTKGVSELLRKLVLETGHNRQTTEIEQAVKTLSRLNPRILSRLVAALPPTPEADAVLRLILRQMTEQQLNALIINLIAQQAVTGDADLYQGISTLGNPLNRLAELEWERTPEREKTLTRNIDTWLLLHPDTVLDRLPDHFFQRLRQPAWSVAVLATAARQAAEPEPQMAEHVNFSTFNHLLKRFEQLLGYEQQAVVARQAGVLLAAMEKPDLTNILIQTFKGSFGVQLYDQIVSQVSDETLNVIVEHLTPGQLSRMIMAVINGIPVDTGTDNDTEPETADFPSVRRLTRTEKGQEVAKILAWNIDARQLLNNPDTTLTQLPDRLVQRLRQAEWSVAALTAAAQQTLHSIQGGDNTAALVSFERALAKYDNLFDPKLQTQVISQVAEEMATFGEQELSLILMRACNGPFGEQLYRRIIHQLSEEKLGKLASYFQTMHRSGDEETENPSEPLQESVRRETRLALIEMHRQQSTLREEQKQANLKTRLNNLVQGDLKVLQDTDVQQALPEMVRELLVDNKNEAVDILLAQLIATLHNGPITLRTAAFHCLAGIGEQMALIDRWEWFEHLLPAFNEGLKLHDINEYSVQQAMTAIGGLVAHQFAEERYTSAVDIIQTLHLHAVEETKTATTNPSLRRHALATLQTLCMQATLEKLMQLYLHSETNQGAAGKLLVSMGGESVKFQLQQLITSENPSERKQILALIKQAGNPALSILQKKLNTNQPWYVLNNAIRLLTAIDPPEFCAMISPFLGHPDLRVQQEVISAASKSNEEDFKKLLLQALHTVDDSMKITAVNHIAAHHDERFVRPLTDLLESSSSLSEKNKHTLQLALCITLGTIGSRQAMAPLSKVAQSSPLGLDGYSDEVRQAAAAALERIQLPVDRKSGKDEENLPKAVDTTISFEAKEEAIFHLAAQGDKEQATRQLFDLIVATTHAGDFKTAERLGERIYEIDSLVLDEIIHSNSDSDETIEAEGEAALKEEHLVCWSALTDHLTAQEFQTIHHALNELWFKSEETIVSQGDKNDSLFFITQGSIKVSYQTGSHELFITTLNRGQIIGENFFTPSFWTITLTSLTPSHVHVLQQSALNVWQEQFPELRAKLHAYYLSCNTTSAILEKKGLERRKDQRFNLVRPIQVQPIDRRGNPIGRGFRSESIDISYGGLAFLIRISRQESARLLLGRRMQVILSRGDSKPSIIFKGTITGINQLQIQENDFSVHFTFDPPLDQQQLYDILD